MNSLEVPCVEITKGDQLAGYAIFFSGGWDAYLVDIPRSLVCIGIYFDTPEGAMRAVKEGKDWRPDPHRSTARPPHPRRRKAR